MLSWLVQLFHVVRDWLVWQTLLINSPSHKLGGKQPFFFFLIWFDLILIFFHEMTSIFLRVEIKNRKKQEKVHRTEWSKACDVTQWQTPTAHWTGQLITEARNLRGICTTIKIKYWNKNSTRTTTSTEKRDCGLSAETSNDKHSIWRVGLSRSLNVETNKKVLVKVGQASLTLWQGQQLHYLNKEHDVNLKWPQHNTASMALLTKPNVLTCVLVLWNKATKAPNCQTKVSGTRQTTKQQTNTMNFRLTVDTSQLKTFKCSMHLLFSFQNLKHKTMFL